jgi:2'-5' RNA ligase
MPLSIPGRGTFRRRALGFGSSLGEDGRVALSVCLLPNEQTDRAVRRLWQRLEDAGVSTLLTHTHGRHVPHLTLASLLSYDIDAVRCALTALPDGGPLITDIDALGMFRRSRVWLAPAPTAALLERQRSVVEAARMTGAEVHLHYRPGVWLPHLTLAPRLTLGQLAVVAGKVNEVLPLSAVFSQTALVQTRTGEVDVLTPGA